MGTKVRSVKSLGHNSNSIAHRQVAALWRTVLRFDPSKLQFEIAARNALASAIPLIAGALAGAPGAGVVASIGALNASFSLKQVEGHTEAIWTPRTYAIQRSVRRHHRRASQRLSACEGRP